MSDQNRERSRASEVFNAASQTKVHHATLEDLKYYAPDKLKHLQKGGIRDGSVRDVAQTQEMLNKIPRSQRAGGDAESASRSVKDYLHDKDASHIKAHNRGGSGNPKNIEWENRSVNRARGDRNMSPEELLRLNAENIIDNVGGAVRLGLEAAPRGAVGGAIGAAPLSILDNTLKCVRGEIAPDEAVVEVAKDVATGAAVGGGVAGGVAFACALCPPLAAGVAVAAPILGMFGIAKMVTDGAVMLLDHEQKKIEKQLEESSSRREKELALEGTDPDEEIKRLVLGLFEANQVKDSDKFDDLIFELITECVYSEKEDYELRYDVSESICRSIWEFAPGDKRDRFIALGNNLHDIWLAITISDSDEWLDVLIDNLSDLEITPDETPKINENTETVDGYDEAFKDYQIDDSTILHNGKGFIVRSAPVLLGPCLAPSICV